MNKYKRISCILLIMLLLLPVCPSAAFGAGLVDTGRDIVLDISYKDGSEPIGSAGFYIYKVADVDAAARMTLCPEFEPYRGIISGLDDLAYLDQDGWALLADTLRNDAVVPDGIAPMFPSADTDENGHLRFPELKAGLYLVTHSHTARHGGYIYTPIPALVFLPGTDVEHSSWDYQVTVSPKLYKTPDDPGEGPDVTTRKVLKIWEDDGYEENRPSSVTVELLCDGSVYDTVMLDDGNNWRFEWTELDKSCDWVLREEAVDGYSVSISFSGKTFVVTNTYKAPVPPVPPEEPGTGGDDDEDIGEEYEEQGLPKTGVLWWPVPMLLCAGLALITAGVYARRSDRE